MTMTGQMPDVNAIMAFENGELGGVATLELFRDLIQSGMAWRLQGHYGRSAMDLLNSGAIFQNEDGDYEVSEDYFNED